MLESTGFKVTVDDVANDGTWQCEAARKYGGDRRRRTDGASAPTATATESQVAAAARIASKA